MSVDQTWRSTVNPGSGDVKYSNQRASQQNPQERNEEEKQMSITGAGIKLARIFKDTHNHLCAVKLSDVGHVCA